MRADNVGQQITEIGNNHDYSCHGYCTKRRRQRNGLDRIAELNSPIINACYFF